MRKQNAHRETIISSSGEQMQLNDPVPDLALFARIVAAGSLSAAGRELGLGSAAVSKRLAKLEARLGARLIHRTSRSLRLTGEGAHFHERCLAILADIAEAEMAVSSGRAEPRGRLAITAAVSFGRRHVAPVAAAFAERYPEVQVHLRLSDAVLDVVGEGLDLAIRIGRPSEASIAVRRLAGNRRVVCASPDYLARCGRPATPAELYDHACLVLDRGPGARQDAWTFVTSGGAPAVIKVSGPLACDNGEALHAWALEGRGLVLKSIWDVADDLAAGRLVELFEAWTPSPTADIHAVYPSRRQLSAKVRVFVEVLSERLRHALPELGEPPRS